MGISENTSRSAIVNDFMSSTTAHGLPRAFQSKGAVISLLWAFIFLTAIGVCVWQSYLLVASYLRRDVTVKIEIVTAPQLPFPSVTICNTNKLRKSAISKSEYNQLLKVDTGIAEPYYAENCLEGDYRCNNTGCVKSYLLCDGVDNCGDKSDEFGCIYGTCDVGMFKCTTGSPAGACIDSRHICDRILDCYGGEDENNCDCKKHEFSCEESGRCINGTKRCDDVVDCDDGSDEQQCDSGGTFCGSGYIHCDDGDTCIPPNWECDSYVDCNDGTDEEDCPEPEIKFCLADTEYQCDLYTCIPLYWKCDGYIDCGNGNDENDCPAVIDECYFSTDFLCDFNLCIPDNWVCDGQADCNDGTDEADCEGTCSGYLCDTDTRCIPEYWVCDNVVDCHDTTDEKDCEEYCGSDFLCDTSRCIYAEWVCDYTVDCTDGSDEEGCAFMQMSETNRNGTANETTESIYLFETSTESTEEPSPTYQPSAHDLLKRYTELSYDLSVYEDFVTNSYHDHQFGRVKSEDPPDWPGFITYSSTPDYSDLENVLKLRADEIAELGHQLEDFVLECSYDEQVCNWEKDFKMFQDERYGNCFQFNHAFDSEDTSLYSTKTGAKYGLKMTLYTEQNEYISVYGRNSGARVVVHPPHIPAIPQSEGITVTPGRVSSVGLKENRIKRKPSPYGECTTITEYESIFGDHYKITVCEETCMQTYMSKYCGCVDTMLSNDTRCMQLNRTQDVCRQLIRYFGRKELLDCKCKQPCEETYYGTTISQSLWPSDTYLEHFLKQIHSKNNKTTFINGFDDVSKNFIRLEVYFDELNYQIITETPAITEEVLLSSIGGTLGLYCGFSFLTIIEFFQLAMELSRYYYLRNRGRM